MNTKLIQLHDPIVDTSSAELDEIRRAFPEHAQVINKLAAPYSIGEEKLQQLFESNEHEFDQILAAIEKNSGSFDLMVQFFGIEAVRTHLWVYSQAFPELINSITQHEKTFRLLLTRWGADVLNDLLYLNDTHFRKILENIAKKPAAYEALETQFGVDLIKHTMMDQCVFFVNVLNALDARGENFLQLFHTFNPESLRSIFQSNLNFFANALMYVSQSPLTINRLAALFGDSDLKELSVNYGTEMLRCIEIVATQHDRIEQAIQALVPASISQQDLLNHMQSSPSNTLYALSQLGKNSARLSPYITQGEIDLNKLLQDHPDIPSFLLRFVASTNATLGFVNLHQLNTSEYELLPEYDVTPQIAAARFPASQIVTKESPQSIFIEFKDIDTAHEYSSGYYLPFDPVKYNLPERKTTIQKEQLINDMHLNRERKRILLVSPSPDELKIICDSYAQWPPESRPQLILGMRYRNNYLDSELAKRGVLDVYTREMLDTPRAEIGDHDVIVLNTKGEMLDFLAVSDLAIVGADRNIMEPASQGTPILYFPGSWAYNHTALSLLLRHSGAVSLDEKILFPQIIQMINNPQPIISGIDAALQEMKERIFPAAKFYSAMLLAAKIFDRHYLP